MTSFLHELFEIQAALHPNKIALKCGDKTMTYKELDDKSSQLSNYLISEGVVEGDVVKICLERSFEMFIGILGTLKSGAAYLPIEPGVSNQRLTIICEDSKHPLFISKKDISIKHSNVVEGLRTVNLDSDWASIEETTKAKPAKHSESNNPAVVLYTSGSTGKPKGVLLTHFGLANHINWTKERYKISSEDVILQHASYNFDFSLLEIFLALGSGAKLVLSRPKFHYESFYLIELMQQEKISILCSVPSLLKHYVKYEEFSKCNSLTKVFMGGEVLDMNLSKLFFERSNAQLINTYGPTECAIAVLHWVCERKPSYNSIPIGKPIAGMKIHLLDKKRTPVQLGEIGEIYISGPGVAEGYYKRPELTASHFQIQKNGERLYKTGDLGSENKEGYYNFHGRIDFQVKIRGQRIELEEIAYYLRAYNAVENCVVVGNAIEGGDMKLVAYYIPKGAVDIDDLRAFLLSKLPEYMVPSLFIAMEEFPLSANGKIDRKALPKPGTQRLQMGISYKEPQNSLQKTLVNIWEEVLEMQPIGITDAYYLLGGDSLRSVMLFNLVEQKLKLQLNIADFLTLDTIEKQAIYIESNHTSEGDENVKYLKKEGSKTPVLIVQLIQSEGYNLAKQFVQNLDEGHPVLTTVPFGLDYKGIPETIESAARTYTEALEKVCPRDSYILVGYSMTGLVANAITELLEKKGKKVAFLFLLDTYHPKMIATKFNDYSVSERFFFYGRKYLNAKAQQRREIRQFLIEMGIRKLKQRLEGFNNQKASGSITRAEKHALNPKKCNFSLAINFQPKKVKCKLVFVTAMGDKSSIHYRNLDAIISENFTLLKKDITTDVVNYKLPISHRQMLSKECMEVITQLFNEFVYQSVKHQT